MDNRFSRIVCGILSVVMCITSTIHVTQVSADSSDDITIVESTGILDVTTSEIKINGSEITDSTTVNDGDTISLKFSWELNTAGYAAPIIFEYDLASQLHNVTLTDKELGNKNGTYYYIENDKLYIKITKGDYGRLGSCELSGTVDIDADDLFRLPCVKGAVAERLRDC